MSSFSHTHLPAPLSQWVDPERGGEGEGEGEGEEEEGRVGEGEREGEGEMKSDVSAACSFVSPDVLPWL